MLAPGHPGAHAGVNLYCNPAYCDHLVSYDGTLDPEDLKLLSGLDENSPEDEVAAFFAMRDEAVEADRLADAVAPNRVFTDAEWARLKTILPLNERDEPGARERVEMMYLLAPEGLPEMRRQIARAGAADRGGISPYAKQYLFRILVGLAIGLFFVSQQK